MEINNIPLLISKFKFNSPEEFYFVQIIRRRKENPELNKHAQIIHNFNIHESDIENDKLTPKLEARIKELCIMHNARAYIRMNKRNSGKIALEMIMRIPKLILSSNTPNLYRLYDGICGEFHHDENKTWVIDLDDISLLEKVTIAITHCYSTDKKFKGEKTFYEVPTLNGKHIICNPFNMMQFNELMLGTKIDYHKDNPTIFYYNDNK